MDPLRVEALRTIERYIAAAGMSDVEFGRAALGDNSFVADLRKGRKPREKTLHRVRVFMSEHPVQDRGAARVPPPISDTAARVMLLAGPQSAGEAIRLVQRSWPDTWALIVAEARQRGEAPGATMISLIHFALQQSR